MQPSWLNTAGALGVTQFDEANPALIHTKTLRKVPLSLTTTTSAFAGLGWARAQAGFADISMSAGTGGFPVKVALPMMLAPFTSSGVAGGPLGFSACSLVPSQETNRRARASP